MVRLLPPERDIGVLKAPIRSNLALAAAFVAVLMAVSLLERIGVDAGFVPFAIVSAAFVLFVLAALYSHSRRAVDFYVADRRIGSAFGGLAAATSFAGIAAIGLAAGAYASTADFLVTATGLAVGYLILALAIAPGLRAFGAYSAGDFIAARFGGRLARFIWAAITFAASFVMFMAHLKIAVPLTATLLDITPEHALYAVAAVTAMALIPGGMRSLTWTQALQYYVIVLACLIPAGFLASSGPAANSLIAAHIGTLLVDSLPAWTGDGAPGWVLPLLLAAFGAASLPHLSARALAAPSNREAATSLLWAVLFSVAAVLAGLVLSQLLVGVVPETAEGGGLVQVATLFAALPAVLAGLLLAGMLAALFALGQAALFAASSALSHDVWDEIIDRKGAEGRRIAVARLIVIGIAAGAVLLYPRWPADPAALVQWGLAFAAAGGFAPLVLGLWWRRSNDIGGIGGMVAGFGFTALVFLLQQNVIPDAMVTSGWTGVSPSAAAFAGMLMSLAATVGLSLVTPAPEGERPGADGSEDGSGALPVRERPA